MKWKAIGLILVVTLGLVISGCTQQETQTTTQAQEITIYTGGTGGVYFPLGSKYAEILTKNDVPAKAVTSGASVANAKAIGDGTAQAAILQRCSLLCLQRSLYV